MYIMVVFVVMYTHIFSHPLFDHIQTDISKREKNKKCWLWKVNGQTFHLQYKKKSQIFAILSNKLDVHTVCGVQDLIENNRMNDNIS